MGAIPLLEDLWDKKWDGLALRDQLIVRELVLLMTLHWPNFKEKMIEEPVGYLDV